MVMVVPESKILGIIIAVHFTGKMSSAALKDELIQNFKELSLASFDMKITITTQNYKKKLL